MVDVSVIIVSWNVSRYLNECLSSLYNCNEICFVPHKKSILNKYTGEIIVVDSCSDDDTLDMLKNYRDIVILPQNFNIGYAKGNNLGSKKAKGEFLFILNPDTIVYTDTIGIMIECMRADEYLGGCSPWIFNSKGYVQIPRKFPDLWGLIFCLPIFKRYPKKLLLRDTILYRPQGSSTTVEWIDGCSMFIRKTAFDEINGFDESFTMFAEEKDLCKRMIKAGFGKMIVLHDAKLLHYGGKSSENNPSVKHIDFWVSELRFLRKHSSKINTYILKISILICYVWLYTILQLKLTKKFTKIYSRIFWETIKRVNAFRVYW